MRIDLLSNHGPIGGGEVMLLQLAEAARQLGHQTSIVAPEGSEVALRAEQLGFAVIGVQGIDRRSLLRSYRLHARQSEADLLWCNGPVPALAAVGSPVPRIVHLHQCPTRLQGTLLRVARLRAVATLVPSQTMAAAVSGSLPFPNWTDAPPIGLLDASQRSMGEVALDGIGRRSGPVRLGFIGRISTVKGLDVLAEAVALLLPDTDIQLIVAGDDRFVPASKSAPVFASLDAIAERTSLIGWVDRDQFHADIDIMIVPSTWDEPFGLVAAEAMARRTPLLVTDAGALPEIVGADHPWIAPRSDPAALAATISAMIADPDRVDRSVMQGELRWEEQFSPTAGTERFARLLSELRL
jgi:glycosyltransferase involved in cell wall biosynthesis